MLLRKIIETYDPEFKVFVMYVYITEPICQLTSIVTYMVCISPLMSAILYNAEINNFLCFVIFTIFITLLSYRFYKLDIDIPLTDDVKRETYFGLIDYFGNFNYFFQARSVSYICYLRDFLLIKF